MNIFIWYSHIAKDKSYIFFQHWLHVKMILKSDIILFWAMLGIESRALYILGKCYINWAPFPAQYKFWIIYIAKFFVLISIRYKNKKESIKKKACVYLYTPNSNFQFWFVPNSVILMNFPWKFMRLFYISVHSVVSI